MTETQRSFFSILFCVGLLAAAGCGVPHNEIESSDETESLGSTACASGFASYNGTCVDLKTNSAHCGRLLNACPATRGCFGGVCTIPAKLPTPRGDLGVVVGPDGLIYAIGGATAAGPSNIVERYNPRTNTWARVANLPLATGLVSTVVGSDGEIHAAAGSFHASYNVSTNTWRTRPAVIDPRYYVGTAATRDGKMLMVGGHNPGTWGAENFRTHRVFNPSTNAWSFLAPMPRGRMRFAMATSPVDGRVYALGGENTNNYTPLAAVDVFNPATGVWSAGVPLLTARGGIVGTAGLDGKIYVTGGHKEWARFDIFNPITKVWTTGPVVPPAHAGWGYYEPGMVTGRDGRIYMVGGGIAYRAPLPNAVDVYEPKRNLWINGSL